MALVLADRVKETTTTTGTGTVTLLGASTGYQSFSAVGNANTTYYTIAGQTSSEWEVGIGTYTSAGTTLSRDTVLASSNGGSLVTFSAGTKDVFVTYPAGRSVYANGTVLTATNSSILPVTSGGTGLSSLIAGYIPFGAGTSAFGSSSDLFWDSANNRLGVGTASPSVKLDVQSSGNELFKLTATTSTAAAYQTTTNTGGNFYIGRDNSLGNTFGAGAYASVLFSSGAYNMGFFTDSAERMRIDSSGNVGIGTTSPNYLLDIYKSTALITRQFSNTSVQAVLANYSADTVGPQQQFYKYRGSPTTPAIVSSGDITGRVQFYGYDGATLYPTAEIRSNVDGTPGTGDMPGRLVFLTTPDGSSTITERMRIDNSGNVGIGTTSPNVKLDVSGAMRGASTTITGAAGGNITPTSDTTNQYTITALGAAATFLVPSGTPADGQKLTIRIKDNGTGRALTWTTSAGGYRIIGTTLPTTTVASKVTYVGCVYNSQDSFWDVVAVTTQA